MTEYCSLLRKNTTITNNQTVKNILTIKFNDELGNQIRRTDFVSSKNSIFNYKLLILA